MTTRFLDRLRSAEVTTTVVLAGNAALGLLAQVVLAARIGPGWQLDEFLAVTALPLALIGIAVTGFSAVIVPKVIHTPAGPARSSLERELFAGGALLAVAIAGVGLLGSGLLTAVGHSSRYISSGDAHWPLASWGLAWTLCLGGLVAQLGTAFHSVRRWFTLQAASGALFPLSLVAASLAPVAWAPVTLVAGYALAAAAQSALLLAPLFRDVVRIVRPGVRAMAHLLAATTPVIIATLPTTVFGVSDAFWSRNLAPGGLSYLGFATRFTIPVAAIATSGVAMVSFPRLVAFAAKREFGALGDDLAQVQLRTLMLLAPMAAVGIALRDPLVRFALQRGAFGESDRRMVTAVVPGYLIGMVCVGLCNLLSRALYAMNESLQAAIIGAITTILYVVGSGFAVHHGTVGISRCYAAVWIFALVAQVALVSHHIGRRKWKLQIAGALAILGASACASVTASMVWQSWSVRIGEVGADGVIGVIVAMLLSASAFGLSYVVLKAPRLRTSR